MAWNGGGRGGGKSSATAPVPCPDCGGAMWDNSRDKKGPKSPDYRCKNGQGCGRKVWLSDEPELAGPGGGGPDDSRPPAGPLPSLAAVQYRCLEHSLKVLPTLLQTQGRQAPTFEEILNYATTLFIAHQHNPGRDVFPGQKKAAAPAPKPAPPPPPPKPVEPPAPPARDPMDEDLPF